MKTLTCVLLLSFSFSFCQNFPGGLPNSEIWIIGNHANVEEPINLSVDSNIRVSNCGQSETDYFNFNECFYSAEGICLKFNTKHEYSKGKTYFFVGEPDIEEETNLSQLHTIWSEFIPNNITSNVIKNRTGIALNNSLQGDLFSSYNNEPSYISYYHWNNYRLNKIYKTYGFIGETEYNVGKNFSFSNQNNNIGAENFVGYFTEFISFPFELDANEKNRVESYLALKYGLTLNSDYKSSTNVRFWNINSAFSNNIFGVGKDDKSGLYQLIAESRNEQDLLVASVGPYAETNIIKQQELELTISDNHFILFGDNNGNLSLNEPNEMFVSTLGRKWLSQNTGEESKEYPINLRFKVTNEIQNILNETDLKLWFLRDPFVNNTEISDFQSEFVEFTKIDDIQEGYATVEEIFFDIDENKFDQYTLAIGPEMIVQVKFHRTECSKYNISRNVDIEITGGTPKYSIKVESENGYSFQTITENTVVTLEDLSEGVYIIYVEDSNGLFVKREFEVIIYNMFLNLGPDQNLSINQQEINLFAGEGIEDPDATYEWYFNGELLEHTDPLLVVNAPGDYEVIVTAGDRSCSISDRITITNILSGSIDYSLECDDDEANFNVNIFGGIPNYNIQVFDLNNNQIGPALVANNDFNSVNLTLPYGSYTIEITDNLDETISLNADFTDPWEGVDVDIHSQIQCGNPIFVVDCLPLLIDPSLNVTAQNVSYEWTYQLIGESFDGIVHQINTNNNGVLELINLNIDDDGPSDDDPPCQSAIMRYTLDIVNNNGCIKQQSFIVRSLCPKTINSLLNKSSDNPDDFNITTKTYPNPSDLQKNASHEVTMNEVKDVEIKVFDILGRQVFEKKLSNESQYTIPLEINATGVYFIITTTSEKILTDRLIIK
ncbi:T9SS type A sorting domain-containing protein [Psychroflexus sp. MBR-150]